MMQIVNGRWVDEHHNSVNEFNCSQLINLGIKVQAIYGEDITHDRIELINKLTNIQDDEARVINRIINEGHLDKLIGV
jgi:hypothetical protein